MLYAFRRKIVTDVPHSADNEKAVSFIGGRQMLTAFIRNRQLNTMTISEF